MEAGEHLEATVLVKLEYFNPAGSDCRRQGLSSNSYHAGNYERRAPEYSEGLWCGADSDRRS